MTSAAQKQKASVCLLRFHPTNSRANEFRSRFQVKLFFDVRAMDFDRFDAQMNLRSNFAGALSFADELEDFQLTI